MKKLTLLALILIFSQPVFAEIVEVYRWKPYPGKANQLLSDMQEAATIHAAMGISVTINPLDIGSTQNVDYVMRFDDLDSWGRLRDANVASAEWNSFYTRIADDPSGELVQSINATNTDPSVMAGDFESGSVFSVFLWDPAPGRSLELAQGFDTAKSIHEGLGARVETYIEGFGGTDMMYYVMIFDSWSDMANFQESLNSSEEWLAFQVGLLTDTEPAATLVQTFAGSTLAAFD
ncbi:uncharacterized protein METZ01_LOCUS201403 [marine metagenome]|uniref:NIPSNAP domain-containing protein n=1 Tax=marine metagenome TaxID=408172 RepID=A0A382EDS4_9ZZZZ|tara:strand:- start:275 stop:976 length:702 start_codon:yes stop_codon:yes gene_type:complete